MMTRKPATKGPESPRQPAEPGRLSRDREPDTGLDLESPDLLDEGAEAPDHYEDDFVAPEEDE